jgi:ABC-2 type transport system permease protein
VLFPGIVAMTAVLTALQSTAFPLVIDFSFTKEIEDRLLAPQPVGMVGVEKILFAAMRAMVAAVVMFPVGILVLGSIPWRASGVPLLITVLVLGSLVGAALGLILGTAVPVNRINVMFALILTPLLFTGASQYPWTSLDQLRWFQVVTACNPLTYVSEGMRAALVPSVPHIQPWISVLVLAGSLVAFTAVGIRLFLRRAIDTAAGAAPGAYGAALRATACSTRAISVSRLDRGSRASISSSGQLGGIASASRTVASGNAGVPGNWLTATANGSRRSSK